MNSQSENTKSLVSASASDIGKTLEQLGSSETIKNILIAMGTAGVGATVQGQGANAVMANAMTGCVAGTLNGSGCEKGAKTAAFVSTAGEAYQSMVGYAANPGPGVNRNGTNLDGSSTGSGNYVPINKAGSNFGQQQVTDRGMNVIALNTPGSALSQGGILSRTLNQVPFINATAGVHDYIFNANTELNFTLWNVPTMLPAAALSIPAALSNPNFSWITQVKQSDLTRQPPAQSIIRVDSDTKMQSNLSTKVPE
jgi:hypothetical protein